MSEWEGAIGNFGTSVVENRGDMVEGVVFEVDGRW